MSYPCHYSDMIPRFGRPVAELSMIINNVMDYIYDVHGHRLTQWNNDILNPGLLETYADAVAQKGAAFTNCFGFIDGTVRPICRPNQYQKIVFNGHKRVHSLKLQSVTLPNGLIANLFGPVGAYLELVNIFKSYHTLRRGRFMTPPHSLIEIFVISTGKLMLARSLLLLFYDAWLLWLLAHILSVCPYPSVILWCMNYDIISRYRFSLSLPIHPSIIA